MDYENTGWGIRISTLIQGARSVEMCGANAIHVATALKPKCQAFITTDAKLSREKFKTSTAERVASLKTLIDQRKTEAEIAEALSMVEKQVKMGIGILERRS